MVGSDAGKKMPERNNTPARLLNLVWIAAFLFCSFPLDVGCEAINQISHHPHHLYPFGDGSGDASLPPGDDTSSNRIRLNVPLPINQRAHEYIFVNMNGLLSTGGPVSRHIPSDFPLLQIEQDWYGAVIAPYWADVNTRLGGRVFWRQDQRAGMLKLVDDDIRQHFPSASDYASTLIFVATWHRVRCFECPVHLVNTFQAVLATDGRTSFVIFKYGRLQWRPHPDLVQAGFDAGDGSFFHEIGAVDLAVGMPGKWIFQLNVQTKTCTTTSASRIEPSSVGQLGGESITISGRCFEESVAYDCLFDDPIAGTTARVAVEFLSDEQLRCIVPVLIGRGQINVRIVETDDGNVTLAWGTITIRESCGTQTIAPLLSGSNRRRRRMIIGGENAIQGSWPFMVSLHMEHGGSQFCGATLIAPQWILTAAHCLWCERSAPEYFFAKIATHFLSRLHEPWEERINFSQIFIHPLSQWWRLTQYDVALVKLERAVTLPFNNHTNIACLPTQRHPVKPGAKCMAVGYGWTRYEPGSESEVLNQVELPIVSTTVCNDSIHYNGSITASMLCAGYDEGDKAPCHGDSGGPLLCVDSSGRWVVEGVTSWGDKCAMPNRPGVFANVSALYRFIVDTIIENDNK